jgi:hypothetical protein
MAKVLITGMSGTGKSATLVELEGGVGGAMASGGVPSLRHL